MAQLKSLSINGNDVVDYVIEQGSLETVNKDGSSNGCTWNYTKWASGKYELWCYYKVGDNVSVQTATGSLFTSDNILPPTLPTDMLSDSEQNIFPVINKTLTSNWGDVFIMNASATGAFKIASPSSVPSCVVIMNYYVIGRWK